MLCVKARSCTYIIILLQYNNIIIIDIIYSARPSIAQYLKWLSMNASVLDHMGGDLLCMATRRLQRQERGLLDPSSVRILSVVSCVLWVCF